MEVSTPSLLITFIYRSLKEKIKSIFELDLKDISIVLLKCMKELKKIECLMQKNSRTWFLS